MFYCVFYLTCDRSFTHVAEKLWNIVHIPAAIAGWPVCGRSSDVGRTKMSPGDKLQTCLRLIHADFRQYKQTTNDRPPSVTMAGRRSCVIRLDVQYSRPTPAINSSVGG